MKNELKNFPAQCKEALQLGKGIKAGKAGQIVVAGVGGSAFAGDVLKTLVGQQAAIEVHRDYSLPPRSEGALVFAVSYSGNTEETISCLEQAKRGKVVGISSGGILEQKCLEYALPHVKVPGNIQPRNALGYLCIPMLNVLAENKFAQLDMTPVIEELEKNQDKLEKTGKQLAKKLMGKIPLIYSSEKLKCISYGWKTRINENAKTHAFSAQFPELDHNELVGYTKKTEAFHTVIIRDKEDHGRVQKRFEITEKLIREMGGEATIIDTVGGSLASRVFNTLHLGDWTSYYLAIENKVDPAPVEVIEKLKKMLQS